MKLKIFIPIICICIFSFSNHVVGQIHDKFTDGNYTQNPTWSGDTAKWKVNSNNELQLNAPAVNDTSFLFTTQQKLDSTEWNFLIKLDFSPSTSNQIKIYIVSDTNQFKGNINGYYLLMGSSGSGDSIEFYKQNGTISTYLCGGKKGHCGKNTNTLRIKIIRTIIGQWNIYSDTLGGNNYQFECSATDNSITTTKYFGWICNYTATRSTRFYFDDIYCGNYIIDKTPPKALSATIVSNNQIDILFDEPVDKTSAETILNYSINGGIGNANNASLDASNNALVHLVFSTLFQTNNYIISINNIIDLANNKMSVQSINFSFYEAKEFDIVIDEIFADPTPTIGLPNFEYFELKNTSRYSIDLFNWSIGDSSNTTIIKQHITLAPDSFLIICNNTAQSSFQSFGKTLGITPFPSLNNSGDLILIKDASLKTIHTVNYNINWYKNQIKKDGGWSLEMIDTRNPCEQSENWAASKNPVGGTPGTLNSINSNNLDVVAPQMINVFPISVNQLEVEFSEQLNSSIINGLTLFNVNEQIGNPNSVSFKDFTKQILILTFSKSFTTRTIYELTINSITDCVGNSNSQTFQFGLPELADSFDIAINEILFNPKPSCYDYIELYNRTNKIIDAAKLIIGNSTSSNVVADKSKLILPYSYLTLTENKQNIIDNYPSAIANNIFEINSLPSFGDDNGEIKIYNQSSFLIDHFSYSDEMHFPLITNNEGVSLERVSTNIETQNNNNWHSASANANYGTPGRQNSQAIELISNDANIYLQSKIFSPNNDGNEDILYIHYKMNNDNYIAQVNIFNEHGILQKNIANQETIGLQGFFSWDGTDNNNQKLQARIYIIQAELFNLETKDKIRFKETCVLKLNR